MYREGGGVMTGSSFIMQSKEGLKGGQEMQREGFNMNMKQAGKGGEGGNQCRRR